MKAHHPAFKAVGAFQAAARPLYAGAVCRQPRGACLVRQGGSSATSSTATAAASGRPERAKFSDLAEGPYFVLASLLDASCLCAMDACCRLTLSLNGAQVGPWRTLGAATFFGLELEQEGLFEQPSGSWGSDVREVYVQRNKVAHVDWKGRFRRFRANVRTFVAPFGGPEILAVAHPDEVAYFRSRLCTDILDSTSSRGVYLEVEVLLNPDNLSMAVVDFEAGGCSSITFSPDTGAVIRERKVREAPRKVEGAYIQPLPTVPPGRRFHGLMGLYLHRGRLAFFRRCVGGLTDESPEPPARAPGTGASPAMAPSLQSATTSSATASRGTAIQHGVPELGPWETTGSISDLGWAEGRRLTPCLAFRDEGSYQVRVVRVGSEPPMPLERLIAEGEGGAGWSGFDWEVGPPALPEVVVEP